MRARPLAVMIGNDDGLEALATSLHGRACDVHWLRSADAEQRLPALLAGRTRVLAAYLELRPSRAFLEVLFSDEAMRRLWGALVYCNVTVTQAAALVKGFVAAAERAHGGGR